MNVLYYEKIHERSKMYEELKLKRFSIDNYKLKIIPDKVPAVSKLNFKVISTDSE